MGNFSACYQELKMLLEAKADPQRLTTKGIEWCAVRRGSCVFLLRSSGQGRREYKIT